MICKIESRTTCCSAILFLLPSLTCFLLPTIFGSLSVLRVIVGPQNCTCLLWQATWNLSHQRQDFIPWIPQTGLQRHEDWEFHPLKSHLRKWELGPNLFPGNAATQQQGASSEIKVFLEKANGNGQITLPRVITWLPKATEQIGRF